MAGRVSLRVQELNCSLETKTLDNVFITVQVSIQYTTIKEKVYSAFYILENPAATIRSYVFDTIRASLCQMNLDHAFESKVLEYPFFSSRKTNEFMVICWWLKQEEISLSLKSHLQEVMHGYGITILNALITDLSPDSKVRNAMNEINASKRLKEVCMAHIPTKIPDLLCL